MANRPATFRQTDVKRLIAGALSAGLGLEHIKGVQVSKDGRVTLLLNDGKSDHTDTSTGNEWDEVLRK